MDGKEVSTWPTLFLVVGLGVTGPWAQAPPYEVTSLEINPGNSTAGWKTLNAEIQESTSGTMGTLKLRKTSSQPDDSRFYAQYFTASGQLCFVLLFRQSRNFQHRRGPFQPGEERTLYGGAFWMGPILKPAELRLYNLRGDNAPVPYLPPGLMTISSPREEKIVLHGTEPEKTKGPLLDVALARVDIDEHGLSKAPEVLYALDDKVQPWLDDFIGNQEFHPAKLEDTARPSEVLVLVRAAVSTRCLDARAFPPRETHAVLDYAAKVRGSQTPPVMTVLLVPTPLQQDCKLCFEVSMCCAGFPEMW